MRKRLSLIEMYRVRMRRVKHALPLLPLLVPLIVPRTVQAQSPCPPLADAESHAVVSDPAKARFHEPSAFACRFDAALTRMFTPLTVPNGTYRVYVTGASIETVVARFRAAASTNVEGAWVVQRMDPLDAYGDAGLYDRAKVARLYVGVRARVAHGPIIDRGRTVASITLVSPYPDASLTRLEPGTLIIDFQISRE